MQYEKLQERKINHDLLLEKDNIDNDLICCICSCLLVDNRQGCSEGHVFCYVCINKWLEQSKTCPSCRREIKSSEFLSKNRFIEKAIEKLNIYCPNKFAFDNVDDNDGCKEIITIGDKKLHLEKCQFKFVKCENVGCNLVIRLNEQDHHVKEQCDFTLYECKNQGCNLKFVKSKLSTHQDKECPFGLIPCKNHQCGELIQRNLYDDHIDLDCKFELIDCEYKNSGCKLKFERGEIDDHYSQINHTLYKIINDQNLLFSETLSNVQNQLNDSLKVINLQKSLLKSTTDSLSTLQNEYNKSKLIIEDQKSKLKTTTDTLSNLQNEFKDIKLFVVGTGELIRIKIFKSSDVNNLKESICLDKENVKEFKERACKMFNLNPSNIKIWDYFGDKKFKELVDCGLVYNIKKDQKILLEEKLPNGQWP